MSANKSLQVFWSFELLKNINKLETLRIPVHEINSFHMLFLSKQQAFTPSLKIEIYEKS